MTWLLLGGAAFALSIHLAKRRRRLIAVLRSDAMSMTHGEMSRKQSAKVRAALDAATSVLR